MTTSWLRKKLRFWERRKTQRVSAHKLSASYWKDGEPKRAKVKDISPRDIYLITEDRWQAGTIIPLTLNEAVNSGEDFHSRVGLRAKVTRIAGNGVCFTFVPEFGGGAAWQKIMAKALEAAPQKDAIGLFRTTKALALLLRISPSAEDLLMRLLSERLTGERAETAIEIALIAADLVASQNTTPRSDVSPATLLRILGEGAKAEEAEVRQFWGGLLATSSLERLEESETLDFVNLLSQMAKPHILILRAACARAIERGWQPEGNPGPSVSCAAGEIRNITGIPNMASVEGNLNLLHVLGLLEQTVKPWASEMVEEVNLTPTSIGLRLYSKCWGKPGEPGAAIGAGLKPAF